MAWESVFGASIQFPVLLRKMLCGREIGAANGTQEKSARKAWGEDYGYRDHDSERA